VSRAGFLRGDALPVEFFVAFRYLVSRRGSRSVSLVGVIAIGGIFIGVMALIVVLAVLNGMQSELREKILGTNAHVIVLTHGNRPIGDYGAVIAEVERVPGVAAAAPFIYSEAILSGTGDRREGVIVRGVDPERESAVTEISRNLLSGDMDFGAVRGEGGRPGAVLGDLLAERLFVSEGDEVVLFSPMANRVTPLGVMPSISRFVVRGIFKTGLYEYDSKFVYLSLADAQAFLGMGDEVSGVEVKVDDIYRAGEIGAEIVDRLGYPFRTNDWITLNHSLFSALKLEKTAMFIILTLIVLVAAFNIVSTLVILVRDKTREIGILKSLGLTSRSIRKIFIVDGFLIGVTGTALGCAGGYTLARLLEKYRFISLPRDVYWIDTLPVQMQAGDFVMIAAASLAISVLATLYPAVQASGFTPVDAIRYE
jgi:lipoprotein-releasing system permease protein